MLYQKYVRQGVVGDGIPIEDSVLIIIHFIPICIMYKYYYVL